MLKKENVFVTITEGDKCYSINELKVGDTLKLVKEPNQYDDEAIKVLDMEGAQYGYIANSVDSVAKGSHSAGYIYNLINDETLCTVEFIIRSKAIGKVEIVKQ